MTCIVDIDLTACKVYVDFMTCIVDVNPMTCKVCVDFRTFYVMFIL